MKQNYRANGKLMLTGEYFVLDGAKTLALPTQKGQTLSISELSEAVLEWKSYDIQQNVWFEATFSPDFDIIQSSDISVAQTLQKMLITCRELNPQFTPFHKKIETHLEFPQDWGLGSSSTLLYNLAQWAEVDAYQLLWKSFKGSGYDIACAGSEKPLIYQLVKGLPEVKTSNFNPSFKNQLFFLHLNQKQNSREGILQYQLIQKDKKEAIATLNTITETIEKTQHLDEFIALLTQHEQLIADYLEISTIQQQLFSEYQGLIKSLGAWGGDFVLVTKQENMLSYFAEKGYTTLIPYEEMIR